MNNNIHYFKSKIFLLNNLKMSYQTTIRYGRFYHSGGDTGTKTQIRSLSTVVQFYHSGGDTGTKTNL